LSLHEEIALLVAAGFTAVEAITAATRTGAQLLHADSLGRRGAGKGADLVVLDGDPVTTIAATRRIAWVMIRGRIIQPDSLRKTWAKWGRSSDCSCSWWVAGTGKGEGG